MKSRLSLFPLIFCALLMFSTTTAQGQVSKNSAYWQQIDSLVDEASYSDAYKSVEKHYKNALKVNDIHEAFVSARYLSYVGSEFMENNLDSSLARYERLLPKLSAVDQSICKLFLASFYAEY